MNLGLLMQGRVASMKNSLVRQGFNMPERKAQEEVVGEGLPGYTQDFRKAQYHYINEVINRK